MRRHILATLIVIGAFAVAAPVASAQTGLLLDATYKIKIAGPMGNPSCPGDENFCGQGSDPTYGPFTYSAVYAGDGLMTTLTFAAGKLVIDETFQEFTPVGNSFKAPPFAHGHPLTVLLSWSVDPASSGAFSATKAIGTDVMSSAGEAASGVIATVNAP
jgi:hypothetical protein